MKRTMRSLIRGGTRRIPDNDLRRIDAPVALITGRHDRFVPLALTAGASGRLGWPLRVIDDAGHVPHIERPEAFIAELQTALRGPTGRASIELRARVPDRLPPMGGCGEGACVRREVRGAARPRGGGATPAVRASASTSARAAASRGIQLAERGWQVTGVDIVDKALRRARERIAEARVEMDLVRGDVTALQDAGITPGFELLLDTGTFHGLDPRRRRAMGLQVSAIAAPEATLLMLVWPRRRRPLIRGASRDEVEAAFPGWTVSNVEPSHFHVPKPLELLLRPDEEWYRLRRG